MPPCRSRKDGPKLGSQPIRVAQGCPPGPILRGIIRIGPLSGSRRDSENLTDASARDGTYSSSPAMHVAVHSLTANPSGRPTVLPSPHSSNVQYNTSSTNCPSSSFVAVNRVQTSGSTASYNCNTTNMHTAPSDSKVSALSVAPTAPSSNEQARSTLSFNSQCQRRHEDSAI
jgi:hypothetical protein